MIETNKARPAESREPGIKIAPGSQVVWQMIQNSANDNLMPTLTWFSWVNFWTIFVGGVLAYVIF